MVAKKTFDEMTEEEYTAEINKHFVTFCKIVRDAKPGFPASIAGLHAMFSFACAAMIKTNATLTESQRDQFRDEQVMHDMAAHALKHAHLELKRQIEVRDPTRN